MVEGTDVGMVIDSAVVPYFPEAKKLAGMGMIPGGLYRNRDFRKHMVDINKSVPQFLHDILYDPQTSGGLLIAVPEKKALKLLNKLHQAGVSEAVIIGEVVSENKGRIQVR
jgi:selenide,water dikinase